MARLGLKIVDRQILEGFLRTDCAQQMAQPPAEEVLTEPEWEAKRRAATARRQKAEREQRQRREKEEGSPTPTPPVQGAKDTAEVHLTKVHEVESGSCFARNYTLYTLQYDLSWLPSPFSKGKVDRRYSEFEAFHGENRYACYHLRFRPNIATSFEVMVAHHASTTTPDFIAGAAHTYDW